MVNFGTFGFDRLWKRRIISKVPASSARVLDLACGTGILTYGIARRLPHAQVIGVDLTQEYLDIALEKQRIDRIGNVEFIHRRAEEISFNQPFDCVTASYLPKYADLDTLTKKVKTILNTGGIFIMHDFTYPTNHWVASLWEFYFRLQQRFGVRFYPEWRTVYNELPILLRETTWVSDLSDTLARHGFSNIRIENLTLGSAAIVMATKPATMHDLGC